MNGKLPVRHRFFYGARSYARCSAGSGAGGSSAAVVRQGDLFGSRAANDAAASTIPCPLEYKRLTVKACPLLSWGTQEVD